MRYYLPIEAFLGSRGAPKAERAEKSARDWFAASERYPRQLHEMNEQEYLAMKRKEYARGKSIACRRGSRWPNPASLSARKDESRSPV